MFLMQRMQWQSSYRLNQQYSQTRDEYLLFQFPLIDIPGRLTCVARSPMTAVSIPIIKIETVKQTQPPPIPNDHHVCVCMFFHSRSSNLLVGGTKANKNFQKNEMKWSI